MTERTTIHDGTASAGELHADYHAAHNRIFLHMSAGGFSHCVSLNAADARKMAEALLKGAFKIEAATPREPEAA